MLRTPYKVFNPNARGPPTTWTTLRHDGPDHLELRGRVFPGHQMALITSGCGPQEAVFNPNDASRAVLAAALQASRGTKEMIHTLSYPPACHLFGCAGLPRDGP